MNDRWQTYHAHCEPFRLYPDRALAAAHRADLVRDREDRGDLALGLGFLLILLSGFWTGVGLALGWALWGR